MAEDQDPNRLEELKHALESRRQLRQATAAFEHAALKPLLLLNGGALIVFMAFLGTNPGSQADKTLAVWALFIWGVGLLSAAAATGCGYFSQLAFYKAHGAHVKLKFGVSEYVEDQEESDHTIRCQASRQSGKAHFRRRIAHAAGIFSLVAFAAGIALAAIAFIGTASTLA